LSDLFGYGSILCIIIPSESVRPADQMRTYSAKLFAKMVESSGDVSQKIDSLAKAIIALADPIDEVARKPRRSKGSAGAPRTSGA